MSEKKYVVTITRQFGSMGRPIAMKMAELLGVEFYDRDLVDQAAKKLNLPASVVDENEERAKNVKTNAYFRMAFPLGRQNATEKQDKIFEAQKNIITFLAEKESCIIVGRCADFILENMEHVVNVYIYADYESRLAHCTHELGMDKTEGKRMIAAVDEARKAYHLNYAGYVPGDLKHMDLAINSAFLGVEGTAEYLAAVVRKKFCL